MPGFSRYSARCGSGSWVVGWMEKILHCASGLHKLSSSARTWQQMLARAKRAEPGCGTWGTRDLGRVLCDRPTAAGVSPTQQWALGSRTVALALGGCVAPGGPTVGTVDGQHHPTTVRSPHHVFLGLTSVQTRAQLPKSDARSWPRHCHTRSSCGELGLLGLEHPHLQWGAQPYPQRVWA